MIRLISMEVVKTHSLDLITELENEIIPNVQCTRSGDQI